MAARANSKVEKGTFYIYDEGCQEWVGVAGSEDVREFSTMEEVKEYLGSDEVCCEGPFEIAKVVATAKTTRKVELKLA